MRSYFKRLNIKGPTPLPMIGNLVGLIRNGIFRNDQQIIQKYGKIAGYFEGTAPVILTTDSNLIKVIAVKEFNAFADRRVTRASSWQSSQIQ